MRTNGQRHLVPESGRHIYSDIRVISVPSDLPDGFYAAFLDRCTLALRRDKGVWTITEELSSGPGGSCACAIPNENSSAYGKRAPVTHILTSSRAGRAFLTLIDILSGESRND